MKLSDSACKKSCVLWPGACGFFTPVTKFTPQLSNRLVDFFLGLIQIVDSLYVEDTTCSQLLVRCKGNEVHYLSPSYKVNSIDARLSLKKVI